MEGVRILDKDKIFMRRALRLAARARGMTSPNPMVGAVIVNNGVIVAEDYHKKAGELHAEALAIIKAGDKAEGSTLYVTLEPCCHLDKRTPPCTKAIIKANIGRVLIAMEDPNPKVSGKGMSALKRHGIEVVEGLYKSEAQRLNEAYIKYITTGKPFVILKVAMTLDGKIATPEGQSKWITGEQSRRLVHKMRSSVDAILTAIGTVKADNPRLTARSGKSTVSRNEVQQPERIVIDPLCETPPDYHIFDLPHETILIAKRTAGNDHQSEARRRKKQALIDKGVEIIEYEGERVDLEWLMRRLVRRSITSVMIEGGSSLGAYALQDGIVDKVVFFIAPKIIGGRHSFPAIGGSVFRRLEDAYRIRDLRTRKSGEDILVEGYITL
ncbi:MAG TPA: bifunctional diaminohydroxyphosphoribosylaminopyrimidine deaminase/5-amino-6-(5-phosphoribosylamino)uracil reductase RibD [Dissulfurispiraceae bacterium]|nr:bifunctional diaminohydroxyphosphoribosylaminopyrimidine deaminase/5-amino-6-(5-phosphoribosylamino)uracil reductase RibD [Dissulfurispiraceae bacterium]